MLVTSKTIVRFQLIFFSLYQGAPGPVGEPGLQGPIGRVVSNYLPLIRLSHFDYVEVSKKLVGKIGD